MPTIPEPGLDDLLDQLKREIMLDMNCHAIGIIQSFNPTNQTVRAKVAYKKTYEIKGEMVLKDYALLMDCPVMIYSGGKAFLTMPIAKGDECLFCFNDRDLDRWFTSGQIAELATARLHAFTDAIAIVGIRSKPNWITSYDGTRARLQYGTTYVGVGESLIKIANATTSLGVILGNLLTALNTFATAASAATPSNVTAAVGVPAATLATAVATAQTQITGLLE